MTAFGRAPVIAEVDQHVKKPDKGCYQLYLSNVEDLEYMVLDLFVLFKIFEWVLRHPTRPLPTDYVQRRSVPVLQSTQCSEPHAHVLECRQAKEHLIESGGVCLAERLECRIQPLPEDIDADILCVW